MPNITFIDYQGTERKITADVGDTVMEVATGNDVPGIDADCGGACACATCHIYVDDAWVASVGQAQDLESEMLEVADEVTSNSRLACQIVVTEEMDGLVVRTPESQF